MALQGPARTVAQTVSVVILMGGLAWASVPFYDWFCRVTGFGGVTGVSEVAPEDVLDQTITIRFDGSLNNYMPWEFKPVAHEIEIRLRSRGKTNLNFLKPHFAENLEHAAFAFAVHGLDEGLVSVPQIDRAPNGRLSNDVAGP